MNKSKTCKNKLAETFALFQQHLMYIYENDENGSFNSNLKAIFESDNDDLKNQLFLMMLAVSASNGAYAKESAKVSHEAYENVRLMFHYRYEFYKRGTEKNKDKLLLYKYMASEKGSKKFKDDLDTVQFETLHFKYSPALTLEENLFNLKMFTEAAELYLILFNRCLYDNENNGTDNIMRLILGQIRNKDFRLTLTSKQRFEKWQRYIEAYDMSQDNTLADIHDKLHSKDERTHIAEESKPGCVWSHVEYAKKLILAAENGTFPEID